jgi:hypothetical protein
MGEPGAYREAEAPLALDHLIPPGFKAEGVERKLAVVRRNSEFLRVVETLEEKLEESITCGRKPK